MRRALQAVLRRHGVLLVGVLCLLAANVVLAHGVTLKVQHSFPEDSAFHTRFLLPWIKQMEEASHGRLRFQLMSAASSGTELFAQVQQGSIDIGYAVIEDSGRFPRFEQFAAPSGDRAAASRALWEHVRANDLAKQEFKGFKLLAVGVTDQAALSVVIMNPAAFKSLTDDLKQEINQSSGAETSARLGQAYDAAAK